MFDFFRITLIDNIVSIITCENPPNSNLTLVGKSIYVGNDNDYAQQNFRFFWVGMHSRGNVDDR